MIERFFRNEFGYESWLKNHRNGYVFNHFGGKDPTYNLIHKSECRTLKRPTDEGVRTEVEKICSDNLGELEREATEKRGTMAGWKYCKICFTNASG